MTVHQNSGSAFSAEQVVNRRVESFPLDVPKRHVNGSNRSHGYRATPPVRAPIQVLPDIFALGGIAPHQAWNYMLGEIGCHRQFPSIQGGIAESVDPLIRRNLEG